MAENLPPEIWYRILNHVEKEAQPYAYQELKKIKEIGPFIVPTPKAATAQWARDKLMKCRDENADLTPKEKNKIDYLLAHGANVNVAYEEATSQGDAALMAYLWNKGPRCRPSQDENFCTDNERLFATFMAKQSNSVHFWCRRLKDIEAEIFAQLLDDDIYCRSWLFRQPKACADFVEQIFCAEDGNEEMDKVYHGMLYDSIRRNTMEVIVQWGDSYLDVYKNLVDDEQDRDLNLTGEHIHGLPIEDCSHFLEYCLLRAESIDDATILLYRMIECNKLDLMRLMLNSSLVSLSLQQEIDLLTYAVNMDRVSFTPHCKQTTQGFHIQHLSLEP